MVFNAWQQEVFHWRDKNCCTSTFMVFLTEWAGIFKIAFHTPEAFMKLPTVTFEHTKIRLRFTFNLLYQIHLRKRMSGWLRSTTPSAQNPKNKRWALFGRDIKSSHYSNASYILLLSTYCKIICKQIMFLFTFVLP